MKAESVPVTVRATVRRPAGELQTALKDVLAHLARSHTIALTVDLPGELQTPVEIALSIPARVHIQEETSGTLSLRIAAAGRRYRAFPAFWGTLHVAPPDGDSSVVTLRGTFTIPFTAMRGIDSAFLRRAAHSTMCRFLESVIQETARVAAALRGAR